MKLTIEVEREVDGRWIADPLEMPSVLAQAHAAVKALASLVIADRIENGEPVPG
jgi:hypothetical protein